MTTKTVEFYFDFGSPAAWLAYTQLPKLAADTGVTVVMRSMLLGGVFQTTGNRPPASSRPTSRRIRVMVLIGNAGFMTSGTPYRRAKRDMSVHR